MRTRFTRLWLLILFGIGPPVAWARTVWIDTDASIGSPIREVDDAFALVLAFRSPELRIAGLSTSYGNASLKVTDRVTRNLCLQYGQSANKVYAGASSRHELGHRTAASDALAATAAKERLTYIALGPLTNLATALRLHPDIRDHIDEIILVGGVRPGETIRFGRNKWLQIHDANVRKDPASVAAVLSSGIPLVLVPITTGADLMLDEKDFNKLKTETGASLARGSATWFFFWTRIVRLEGGPLFDATAIVAAARPEMIATEFRYASLNRDGALVADRSFTGGARRIRYCTSCNRKAHALVMRRLTYP